MPPFSRFVFCSDSLVIPLMNSGTSIFSGFVIFSIIGFMANEAGLSVDKVVTHGKMSSRPTVCPVWIPTFSAQLEDHGTQRSGFQAEHYNNELNKQNSRLHTA